MSTGDGSFKSDDPIYRRGLRERLKMRTLTIGSSRVVRSNREPTKDESELQNRIDNYTKNLMPPALPYDTAGALKVRLTEIKRMAVKGEVSEGLKKLEVLEKETKKLTNLGTKRDLQKSRLPADPTSLAKGKFLAEGSFGKVYLAESDTGESLVVKTGIGPVGQSDLVSEVDTYALVGEHENIVKCYGMHDVEGDNAMVLEAVTGGHMGDAFNDLNDLRNNNKISQAEYWGAMQHLFRGLIKGLAHMEEKGFVHNDLKGNNVLFDDLTGEVKIADIGLATGIGESSKAGQLYHVAPEKLTLMTGTAPLESLPSTISQDMYSVGQMLYGQGERELSTGEDGVTTSSKTQLFAMGEDVSNKKGNQVDFAFFRSVDTYLEKNENGEYVARALVPETPGTDGGKAGKFAEGYESEYVKFLNSLMHPDPNQRLSPSDALNHPFLKDSMLDIEGAKSVLDKMVRSRTEVPVDPEEAKELALAQQAEKRTAASVILKDLKKFNKDIQEAQKLDEKVLRAIESHSKALTITKSGKTAVSPKDQQALDEYLKQLNKFEAHLTEDARMVSNITREFGELIPSKPPEDDDGEYKKDCKNLEKLAYLSRMLTTTHGQVTSTIRALENLQETIKEQDNKGAGEKLAPESPKDVRSAAESIREAMEDYFDVLQSDNELFQKSHAEATKYIAVCEKLNEASLAGGPGFPNEKLEGLDDYIGSFTEGKQTTVKKWQQILKNINAFKELTGATTRREKGRKSGDKAVELAQDDRNLLISVSALERRIEWLIKNFTQQIDALTSTKQDCVDGINRRLNNMTLQVRKREMTPSTMRALGDDLNLLESLANTPFAHPKMVKNAKSTVTILRMRMQSQLQAQSKPSDTSEDSAKLLLQFSSPVPPSSKGNSDSFFIKGIDGRPAFILKPSNGESRFSDVWPEGGGAPREILMSQVSDLLENELGLKVGIPKTSLATIDDPGFANGSISKETKRVGALQETFKIKGGDPPDVKHMFSDLKHDPDIIEALESIDPKDVEAVSIFDFLTLNCDRHSENMMVQNPSKEKGKTRLAPIDSGQCLPNPEAFKRGAMAMTCLNSFDPENPNFNPNDNLLMQMPCALQKMSPEAQESLDKLDPDDFAEKMKEQYKKLGQASSELAGKIEDSSFEMVKRSAKLLKAAASELTLLEISQIYASGFARIIDAEEEDVDELITQTIEDLKEYRDLGGDEALLAKRVSVSNPPLSLQERLSLLKKLQDPNANASIEQFKTVLHQLSDIAKYIADSSDEDKQFASDAYALRDTLTQENFTGKLANGIISFVAYKSLGGDPMLKNLLAGNDKAYKAFAKSQSVNEKSLSVILNPIKEFFRQGGYSKLKKLLGDSEYDKLDDNVRTHTELLESLLSKGPVINPTSGSPTGSGDTPKTTTSSSDPVPPPTPPSEEETKRLALGDVKSSNPTLWFDNKQFGDRYRISDSKPNMAGQWMRLNQFCSLLSVRWLNKPSASLKFSNLSEQEQLDDAEELIAFTSLESQVSYAAKAIGGTKRTSLEREDLDDLKEGTKIWFGSDLHAMAAVIGKDGQASFYDPDSGTAEELSLDNLATELKRGNVYVVGA